MATNRSSLSAAHDLTQGRVSSCMTIAQVLVQSVKQGMNDNIPSLSAAVTFYALLSLVPVFMLLLTIVGIIYGESDARNQIHEMLARSVGSQEADTVQSLLMSSTQHPASGFTATIVGFFILIYGASNVFNEWRQTINLIWKTAPKPTSAIKKFLYQRFLSAFMVLAIGLVMIASAVLSAVLTALGHFASDLLPVIAKTMWIWGLALNLGILTLFFAISYKVVPDEKMVWRDVWVGASITAIFFAFGQFIIGFYLAHTDVVSGYGAAGSLIALLIWIYYSAQISFFGAEFTHIYAHRCGSQKKLEN